MAKKVKRDDKGTMDPFQTPYVENIVNPRKSRNQLAAEHPNLRNSAPGSTEALGHLRTRRGNTMDTAEFTGGADSITPGGFSHAGEVGLRLFDAAGQAGAKGPLHPTANPLRPADHTARDSGTPCDEGCGSGAHYDSDFLSTATARKHQVLDMLKDMARKATQ